MTAVLKYIKYTGKSSQFGTEVTSIGLKRVDQAVPAVYGEPITPGDDKSDVNYYPILVPDNEGTVWSFESIFKIHLKTAPDNQLSNIRIYPVGDAPTATNVPKLFIGCSQSFSRPTNTKSLVAINNIWDYSKETPFEITIAGLSGYEISPEVFSVYEYQITVGDTGSGNKFFLNGDKQPAIKIIEGNTYTFINNVTDNFDFRIFNTSDTVITNPDIVYSVSMGNQIITINATSALMGAYPAGFKYGEVSNVSMGSTITWFDIDDVPTETVEYDVEVKEDLNGTPYFYLNDSRNPVLSFEVGKKYKFTNISGDTNPFRIFSKGTGGTEDFVIVEGVTVTDGGTVNEVVLVDTLAMDMAGKTPYSYQSTTNVGYGNVISLSPLESLGAYNMNTVGGGINPEAAGETDYIYLQIEIDEETLAGLHIPNLIIEYDES